MSRFTLTFGIAMALLAIASAAEELYSAEHDNIDVKAILSKEEDRIKHWNCFNGSGPCPTPTAQFYKDHLSEAIATQCRKCTEKQKEYLDTWSTWYTKNSPEEWNNFMAKLIEDSKKPSSK